MHRSPPSMKSPGPHQRTPYFSTNLLPIHSFPSARLQSTHFLSLILSSTDLPLVQSTPSPLQSPPLTSSTHPFFHSPPSLRLRFTARPSTHPTSLPTTHHQFLLPTSSTLSSTHPTFLHPPPCELTSFCFLDTSASNVSLALRSRPYKARTKMSPSFLSRSLHRLQGLGGLQVEGNTERTTGTGRRGYRKIGYRELQLIRLQDTEGCIRGEVGW